MRKYTEIKTINTLNKLFKQCSFEEADLENKSKIIENILSDLPVELIVLNREIKDSKDIVLDILSGEKTINAINLFIEDKITVDGKLFSELDDDIKDEFLDKEVVLISYYNIDEKIKSILINMNNKINDNSYVEEELSYIDKLFNGYLKNEFFDVVNINPISNDIIAQILMIQILGPVELSSRRISKFKNDIQNDMELLDNYDLNKILSYLKEAFPEKTNYLKKAHLPIIALCATIGLVYNIKPGKFKEIMDSFFNNLNKHSKYKEAGSSHTTSKKNVEIRIKELTNFFKKQIK